MRSREVRLMMLCMSWISRVIARFECSQMTRPSKNDCCRSHRSVFPFTFFQCIGTSIQYWLLPRRKKHEGKQVAWNTTAWAQTGIFKCVIMDSAARLSLQCLYFSPTQNHLDICPLFPVKCPNMCGNMEVPREKVQLTYEVKDFRHLNL